MLGFYQPSEQEHRGMDAGPISPQPESRQRWRPEGCDQIALVLQGGGALGAYQAGVYEALHEAGLEPDWIAGVSIGSINGVIIAGNPPEKRLEKLREFWETITARPVIPFFDPGLIDGDGPRRAFHSLSSSLAALLGQPGFFEPRVPSPWFAARGAQGATSLYTTEPLRKTLGRLVDFELLNQSDVRYAAGAVNVATGNFYFFDSAHQRIAPEHAMASGALPPALPMMRIGTDYYWDGGIVSNTPLQHLLEHAKSRNLLIFQVDLFGARGPVPRDMYDVAARQKDIQYSSRTRMVTDMFMRLHREKVMMRQILGKVPEGDLSEEERRRKQELASLPEIALLHLIYQQKAHECENKDYDFSASSMHSHWKSGYRDTKATLQHGEWLKMPSEEQGIVMHDIHHVPD
jgi:NTE family protein